MHRLRETSHDTFAHTGKYKNKQSWKNVFRKAPRLVRIWTNCEETEIRQQSCPRQCQPEWCSHTRGEWLAIATFVTTSELSAHQGKRVSADCGIVMRRLIEALRCRRLSWNSPVYFAGIGLGNGDMNSWVCRSFGRGIRGKIRCHWRACGIRQHGSQHSYVQGGNRRLLAHLLTRSVLWNTTGECENYGILSGHKGAVLDLQWSRDSRVIYSASADMHVASWDVESGQRIRKHPGHEEVINAIDVSKRGEDILFSASDDGYIGVRRRSIP